MIADAEVVERLAQLQMWTAIGVAVLIALHVLLLVLLGWPTREERQQRRRARQRRKAFSEGRVLDVVEPHTVDRVIETARRQGSHD